MADPTLDKSFLILLGDGATPENFAFPCGANARDVSLKNNTGEDTVLDCDDPNGVVPAIVRHLESQDTSANIAGKVAKESFAAWREWADAEDGVGIKNIRLVILNSAADGGGYWQLPAILSDFQLTREGTKNSDFTASISGAGRREWVAAT